MFLFSPPREEGKGEVMKFSKYRGPKSGSPRTIPIRRKLRREMTAGEKVFWAKVARRQFNNLKFRRQHAIGNYIVDFYCPEKKLIIEIDGDSHAEELTIQDDRAREDYLESFGYKIIRYQNSDILNSTEGVFEDLIKKLEITPSTSPSRGGERKL